ncbi:SpoIIIAH-like family protein [Dehalobacter sp. DCM]|uniref:SpoIIIAH-like family protein n=1 Tax=Dehalobacter sp. DCM TaxID=2907827 RepID=UPI003081470A|nr:SpoIIIAH-like family protein [Dehalobacter sp. DCM]
MLISEKTQRVISFIALIGLFVIIGAVGYAIVTYVLANVNAEQKEETNDHVSYALAAASESGSSGFSSELVNLTNNTGQNYFVDYRIKREQYRQEKKVMLEPLLIADFDETRREAQKSWLALCEKISQEGELENVLKIKGYKDVVSEVSPHKASITVLSNKLTEKDIIQIKAVAAEITGFTMKKIEVTAISEDKDGETTK